MSELISTRQAIEILEAAGCNHLAARQILASGLAGPAVTTRSVTLYRSDHVHDLAPRPHVDLGTAFEHPDLSGGVFVVRQRARHHVDEDSPPRAWIGFDATQEHSPAQDDALRMWWTMSRSTAERIRTHCQRHGFLPLVSTVGTLVATGRNITGIDGYQHNQAAFTVAPAGDWFTDLFSDRWFNTGKGPSWKWLTPP